MHHHWCTDDDVLSTGWAPSGNYTSSLMHWLCARYWLSAIGYTVSHASWTTFFRVNRVKNQKLNQTTPNGAVWLSFWFSTRPSADTATYSPRRVPLRNDPRGLIGLSALFTLIFFAPPPTTQSKYPLLLGGWLGGWVDGRIYIFINLLGKSSWFFFSFFFKCV